MRAERAALIAACAAILSCAPPPAPPVTVAVEAQRVEPPTPAERLLALLTADNPHLERVAMSLASVGDRAILHLAGARLVMLARAIGTPAWREAERSRIEDEADEKATHPVFTQALLEQREARAFTTTLAAMFHTGGPAVVAYCFEVAEDEAAPLERRRLALRVLDGVIDPGDMARIERRAQLAARLRPPPTLASAHVSDALVHVRRAFARCYNNALKQDPTLQARVQLRVRVGPKGVVTASVEGDPVPVALARCLQDAAKSIATLYDEQPGTEVTVPFVFLAN